MADGVSTVDPTRGRPAEAIVLYAALVLQVELLQGGELVHASARRLSDRGGGLGISEQEQIEFPRAASRSPETRQAEGQLFFLFDNFK